MSNWTYKSGQWNVHCDVCGFKFKSNEIKKRWDGLMVCDKDYELDHPQKYLRVQQERIATPWVRKQNDDLFVASCDVWTSSAYADFGTADCMRIGNNPSLSFLIQTFYPQTKAIAEYAIPALAISGVI